MATRILVGAAVLTGAAMVLFTLLAKSAPVVDRGALLPFFPGYEVEQVRLPGGALAFSDVSTDRRDVLTGAVLLLAALPLAMAAARLRSADVRSARALAVLAAGAAFLALDEVLTVHETVGHDLPWLARLPFADHPDDVIVVSYGVVALGLAVRVRFLLERAPVARRLVAAAGTAAVLAVATDASPARFRVLEESLEVAAASLLLAAVVSLTAGPLRAPHAAS